MQVGLLVAATRHGDTLQRQITSCVQENFHGHLCRCNKSQKLKSDSICAICCGNKILLQRQRFLQKSSTTQEVVCLCDTLPRLVAAFFYLVVLLNNQLVTSYQWCVLILLRI